MRGIRAFEGESKEQNSAYGLLRRAFFLPRRPGRPAGRGGG